MSERNYPWINRLVNGPQRKPMNSELTHRSHNTKLCEELESEIIFVFT